MRSLADNERACNSGWTFMEVLIVVAIIAVLTAVVGYESIKGLERARRAAAAAQIDSLGLALDSYYIDTGSYPDEDEGLDVLYARPADAADRWQGPYLSRPVSKDPWGNNYEYRSPGSEGRAYEITSFGADGRPGGDGKDADITSWQER